MTTVYNLLTQEQRTYSLEPRAAVIAAYAQGRNDWNTWDYETRYGHLPIEGRHGWHIEHISAPKKSA